MEKKKRDPSVLNILNKALMFSNYQKDPEITKFIIKVRVYFEIKWFSLGGTVIYFLIFQVLFWLLFFVCKGNDRL